MSSEALPISNPRFAAALQDLSLASLHLKTLEIRNALAHLAYSNAQLRPFAEGSAPTLDTAAAAPAANNTETTTTEDGDNSSSSSTRQQQQYEPDPDCVEAIRENDAVMRRMRERIDLVRAEVEGRGVNWREFEAPPAPAEDTEIAIGNLSLTNGQVVNGDAAPRGGAIITGGEATPSSSRNNNTTAGSGNPWTDGTFQTGVIRNGEVHMDAVPGSNNNNYRSGGGSAVDATTTAATSNTTTTTGGGRLTDDYLRRLLEQRLAEDDDEEEGGLHL